MRSIHWLCVTPVFAGAMLAPSARAMDLATYDSQRRAPPNSQIQVRLRVYVLGVGEGLRLANAHLAERGEQPLFCLPESVNLFAEDYFKLIDAALKDSRAAFDREQRSVESILLSVLRDAHPCPSRVARDSSAPTAASPAGSASAPASGVAPVSTAASAADPGSTAASSGPGAVASSPSASPVAAPASAPLAAAQRASAPARGPGWGASTP